MERSETWDTRLLMKKIMDKRILKGIALPYGALVVLWLLVDEHILHTTARTWWIVIAVFVVCFVATYALLLRQKQRYDPVRLASIIISEVFNDIKLDIDYEEEIKKLIDYLEHEKGNSMLSMAQYKEFEKMRFDFSANVTHELKIPLTSIMGHAELIEAGIATDEKAKEFASVIRADGDKLLTMIDDIITLSKYSKKGGVELHKEVFDLCESAEKSIDGVRNIASLKGITIEENLASVPILADREKIETVITNLLTNAVKYNKKNGTITITTTKQKRNAVLSVRDTGIGVSKKDAARVFERFYVANKARGKNAGTGLGLAIVKHIVIAHGGKVELVSTLGSGSEFIVRLPLDDVHL